jgi:hypothetical protein
VQCEGCRAGASATVRHGEGAQAGVCMVQGSIDPGCSVSALPGCEGEGVQASRVLMVQGVGVQGVQHAGVLGRGVRLRLSL